MYKLSCPLVMYKMFCPLVLTLCLGSLTLCLGSDVQNVLVAGAGCDMRSAAVLSGYEEPSEVHLVSTSCTITGNWPRIVTCVSLQSEQVSNGTTSGFSEWQKCKDGQRWVIADARVAFLFHHDLAI